MRRSTGRRGWVSVALLGLAALLLGGCAGYGGRTVGKDGADALVKTEGEHCAITLPTGWTWYPAKWTAESPTGTQLSFDEIILGRPQNPDWSELRQSTIADVTRRNPSAVIEADDSVIRIDYGAAGGLSVIRRFDRIGCRLAFSNSRGTRAAEAQIWQGIIDSLERASPTPNFTPSPED
ncbi:MAG TPA: hypothetical protein PK593_07395 [Thermomicrobiales bacterium]|nr:hypothetical protein [Thermomicrobiales bacterium]